MLAKAIVEGNNRNRNDNINLKGFFVGNPSGLSPLSYNDGYANFIRNHGFMDDMQYDAIKHVCKDGNTPIDEFLDDDGISHIVEGGLKLKVDYEMNGRNNSCKLYASIV